VTRALRAALLGAAWLAAACVLAGVSLLLAAASAGVLATPRDAWTHAVEIGGIRVRVSVVGLVRLATLPGVAHLLDGRSVSTHHGQWRFARAGARLRVSCTPCRLRHPALAAAEVRLPSLAFAASRDGDALAGELAVGTVQVPFIAVLRTAGIDVEWTLPDTDAGALARSIGDALPEAQFARVEGTVRARGTLALPSMRSRVEWSADALEVGGLGTEVLQHGWFAFACRYPDGSTRRTISGDGEKAWAAVDSIGRYLAAAVLSAEDQRFFEHAGYDARELAAILQDFDDAGPRRGASTITQQLARTLFTGGERTAARKLRELLYAIEMERTLGKARILELYLNTVDWGPGLCGAKAAARAYFNKTPARLTPIEAAWLAGALRNPHAAWRQQVTLSQPDRVRATEVLMQMRDWPKRERRRWAQQPLAFAAPAAARRGGNAVRPLLAQPPLAAP
jgi:hypothetical protein